MAKELGEILVEQGTLSDEQLKRAELYARQNNVSVGDALVSFGFATEEQVTAARAKHHSLPYASKENGILNPERDQDLQKLIPEKFARENLVVPLFIEDEELAAAFLTPFSIRKPSLSVRRKPKLRGYRRRERKRKKDGDA